MDSTIQRSPIGGMQFRQHSYFYPAGAPADKMSSSALSRSGDGPYAYPHISRQNSSQAHNSSLANLAQPNYLINPHHELYPAPPPIHNHREPVYHHGSPQSWPPYEQGLAMNMASGISTPYDSFPTASPYPPPRLSPPPSAFSMGAHSHPGRHGPLAGSLDPTTGIFYRTPDHPRLRTAQACEKCRTRKAKCSGEHPSCKRCINRGLVCEYAKEGRVRGPNKPKANVTIAPPEEQERTAGPRNRSSSTNTSSSSSSLDYFDVPSILTSLRDHRINFPQGSVAPDRSRRASLSLGENRLAGRSGLTNLHMEAPSVQYRLDTPHISDLLQSQSPHLQSSRGESSYNVDMSMIGDIPPEGYTTPSQYQAMHTQEGSSAVMHPQHRGEQQGHLDFTLPQTDVEHRRPSRPHESSPAMLGSPGAEPLSQYQVGMEEVNRSSIYNAQRYSNQDSSAVGLGSLHPDLSPFNSHVNYTPQALNRGADSTSRTVMSQALTPATPSWVELRPSSSLPSFIDGSFSGHGSSSSSSTATELSFRPSHSEGTLPEDLACQERGQLMESQSHNMSCSTSGTSGDPHQGATGRGSTGLLQDEPPNQLNSVNFMVYP